MAITNEGDSQTFTYTGGMQSFTAPQKGIYKLEVWGAQGGGDKGGKGGYSYGHRLLEKGAVIYICCGQAGWQGTEENPSTGSTYNGGGGSAEKYQEITEHLKPTIRGQSGGGATHMATVSGTLSSIGASNLSKILLVAGGGGGANSASYGSVSWTDMAGGTGGGTSGGTGSRGNASAAGGTQTGGYAFGQGQKANAIFIDWNEDSPVVYHRHAAGGGGGGLYGGYAMVDQYADFDDGHCGGGGGSGYTGGVPALTYNGTSYANGMTNGSRAGNGYAQITFVKKGELPVSFNGTKLQRIVMNGTEVKSLIFNGVRVFMDGAGRRLAACMRAAGLARA